MSLEYSRSALRITVAQICQNLGWNSIHAMPLELLTDVLERYLFQLSKLSHRYAEQFGLTDPRLEDVGLALGHMGVSLGELEDYIKHVDLIEFPKEVVAYPAPSPNDLKFPNPDSKEVQQRKVFEFVPEHLPYMHPELNEDTEDSNPALPGSPERLQVDQQPQTAELSPGPGEKRPISSPGDSNLPFKRPRLTTNQLPDEASHSQYEITSVVMTHSGILSPLRQGKIPDSRTPPVAKQIVIVKSTAPGAQKGPVGTVQPGVPLNPETPIIKLDFSKDPVNGKANIVEVGTENESGTQVNFDGTDPEYVPKKKVKDKNKLGAKGFKIKRGPGRPRSPGRAPPVIHKKSEMPIDIYKMLQLSRKDDSLGKLDVPNQQGPMDLSVKPTPAPPNISVKLDDSLKAKASMEHKPKIVTISKEQEKDMEDTIASVIQRSTQESEMLENNESGQPQSLIYRESAFLSKSVKKENKDSDDVWRVSSISETYTDENAHDSFEGDSDRGDRLLSPPQPMFTAPHLQLLQQSPKRPRGRPRGSTASVYRGLARRGRPPGRPPLNRSPGRPSPGRPPLNRSPGRPPLNRSPGRPPGSGRSPGRPKGSTKQHNHSPKPRGRPRGSKSPRSRGSSPRGMSPRAAIQNINFDISSVTDSSKLDKEDSNDSEATMFEFPTQSPESDTDKKVFDFVDDDDDDRHLPKHKKILHKISPAPSPVPSPKKDSRDISPEPSPPHTKETVQKDIQSVSINAKKSESFDLKREPSSDLSDKEVKDKLQDSEDDSRKTTNYGELDNQLRGSEERESSTEHVFKKHFQKEKSSDREKRESSKEWDVKGTVTESRGKRQSEELDLRKDKENKKAAIVEDDGEESTDREDIDLSPKREFKEHIIDTKYREKSKERDSKEPSKEREESEHIKENEEKESSRERDTMEFEKEDEPEKSIKGKESKESSRERDHKEHGKAKDHKEYSRDRDYKEHSRERDHKEYSAERDRKDLSEEREFKEPSKDRELIEQFKEKEHKERSKEKEHKERGKDKEHKERSKDREHKERSKEKEHKEHGKDKEHKEHRREKDHKKDKKKKKKKDKDKDRERDKDEKKEKKDKHKSREKESREESPSIQPLVQKLKIKFGGGTASSPGSFSISAATTNPSPLRDSVSPVHRPEIPKLKFKVLPPKPESGSGADKDRSTDPQNQSWTSSVKVEKEERASTPKREPKAPSPAPVPEEVKPEPMEVIDDDGSKGKEDSENELDSSIDVEKEVTVSVIKGKITGIGGAKKPGKRGKRKGSMKKGKPKTPKLVTETPVSVPETKVLPIKKGLEKASSESPSNLFSMENAPSPITIPALKAAPPPPSPPASKKSPPKPKPILKEKELKPPSPLVKEVPPKPKPPPVPTIKAAKISKSPRRSSPRKSPKISPPVKKKGASLSTSTSQSPSPKPTSPTKSSPFDFTVPRTPSPSPLSTPSHSAHSSPMYSPASSPSRDSLTFNIPPTPAFPTRTTSPPTSPPSRQISTDDEKEATPPVEKTKMPPPTLPPMPPTSAMRRQQRSVVAETIGSFVNETGEKIWICPSCTMQDDGSPMVGCDICDDWYHWVCVGIKDEPTEDVWYCPKCKPTKTLKKRGRKKKR